jgi:isopentenyl-diphosphate delta-isomerase
MKKNDIYKSLIRTNERGQFIGYIDNKKSHHGKGIWHKSFIVFIFNKKKQLLISKRSLKENLWSKTWDVSCWGHISRGDIKRNKILKKAIFFSSSSCLKEKLGIVCELEHIANFKIEENFKNKGIEKEHISFLIGKYNKEIKIKKRYKWIEVNELSQKIKENPEKFSPWLKIGLKKYQELHFDISDYIKETNQAIDDFTKKWFKKLKKQFFHPEIYSAITHLPFLRTKTLKVRGVLLRLLFEITGRSDWKKIVPLMASLELYGNSTYTLDDIFDNQPIRVGQLATWQKFGLAPAIISGIVQRDLATQMILEINIEKDILGKVFNLFEKMDYQLYIGQYLNEKMLSKSKYKDYLKRTELISLDPYYFTKMLIYIFGIKGKEKDKLDYVASKWRILAMLRNDFMNLVPEEIKKKSKTKVLIGKTYEDMRKGLYIWPLIHFFKNSKNSKHKNLIRKIIENRKSSDKEFLKILKIILDEGSLKAFLDYILKEKNDLIKYIKTNFKNSFPRKKLIIFIKEYENTTIYYKQIANFVEKE